MEPMIFKPAARYPADPRAVFILAVSVFTGATALALETAPTSLEAALPHWAVTMWSIMLCLGSAITLIGMAFHNVNGIIAEQIGSVIVGASASFYSGIAVYYTGPSALQTVGIIAAWGIACFVRWVQLQILINDAARRAESQAVTDRVEAEILQRSARELAEARARRARRGRTVR